MAVSDCALAAWRLLGLNGSAPRLSGAHEKVRRAVEMPQFFADVYIIAVGFTVAGLLATGSRLLTGRPMRFALPQPQGRLVVASVLVRALAGPQIIMRNAILAAVRGINKPYWVAATTVIASLWSFISGACVLLLIDGLAAWLS